MTSILIKPSSSRPINAPTVHRLPNGLTIVAEQLPVEAVNLNVWLNVGSANEPDNINGMAHFLEHMVFKGTPQLEMGEFERLIEERGAVTNAATSQDYTHYYITTAPHDFAELAPLQLDVVFNASIPHDAFERERFVVLEEIRRSEDNPSRRSFRHSMEMAFERLPYRRPVLGPSEVIEQVTSQQMRDFHRTHYQPSSTTVAVVGNLPAQTLIEIVENSINEINPQPWETTVEPHSTNLTPETCFDTIVRQEMVDESLQQARLVMIWRTPGLNQLDETYALDILATILGQGRTARFVQDLRENRGLVSSISVSHMTQRLQGVFYISARLPVENLAEVEAAIIQHMERIQTELISEAEIARIRTQVANRYIFGNETPSDRAGLYGYYQSVVGDLTVAFNYPARIQAINAEDLRSAAQKYLSAKAYGVTYLKPITA
ncbi:pitrilysin family protein [Lyngbya sp. PCC 8106]|uniref:M16 family metallopeptidase n=1 Tax=Lyngbya sp. (strain PCC 8106) TaxID=313612 RepID=UPI0000EAB116|nr:pitrilysin family protein [Lyngbya sp. PCC 8106]EAW39262.1 processing protease [Lyngbya sp. PCC 8106]